MLSDCTKMWAGYQERFGTRSTGVTQVHTCDWSERIATKNEVLGTAHSDFSWMVCTEVTIEAVGDPSDVGGYDTAKLIMTFKDKETAEDQDEAPIVAGESDAFIYWKERWEGSAEAITVGTGGFKWSDTGAILKTEDNVQAVKVFPTALVTLSGHTSSVTAAGKEYILDAMGTVNAKTITIRSYAYSDEHLLFLGTDLDEGMDNAGNTIHSLAHKFAYRHEASWNEFWDPDRQAFHYLIGTDTSAKPYSTSPFSDLSPHNW